MEKDLICTKCKSKKHIVYIDNVLLSHPPKFKTECVICGEISSIYCDDINKYNNLIVLNDKV